MEIQDLETYAIPSSVEQLCRDMQLIEAREHVIPQAVKSKVMAHSKNSVLRDINFAAEEEHRESLELGLGHESFWERVVEILGAASECHTNTTKRLGIARCTQLCLDLHYAAIGSQRVFGTVMSPPPKSMTLGSCPLSLVPSRNRRWSTSYFSWIPVSM